VDTRSVFTSPDVKSTYELPLELHRQGLDERLAEVLNIWSRAPHLERCVKNAIGLVQRPSGTGLTSAQ
jgi:CTP synthase